MTNMTRIKILDETFSRITNKSFRMKKLLMSVPAHVKEVVFQPKITPGKTSNPHVKTLKGIQSLAKTLYEKFDIVIFLYTECGSCSNPDAIPYLFSIRNFFSALNFASLPKQIQQLMHRSNTGVKYFAKPISN